MARFIIGTIPATGHVTPLLPIARALVERGHHVRWLSGARQQARIAATGVHYEPYRHARDIDETRLDDAFPERVGKTGLSAITFDIKHAFLSPGLEQLDDLHALCREQPADALIADVAFLGAQLMHERSGVPLAVVNTSPLFMTSRDTAPLGLALPPSQSCVGRARNRLLHAALRDLVLRDVRDFYRDLRKRAGLSPRGWFLDTHERTTVLLHPSIPSLEYPRSDLPANVHFIGLLPADTRSQGAVPHFVEELSGRPVVHVTQGTLANARPDLIAPALEGLAREDVWVVVATGGRDVREWKLPTLPRNARVSSFIPYEALMPKLDVMLSNGGFGGVQIALSHGVPVGVAGATEEKPEIAARVAYSGAGLNLKTGTPTPKAVRNAVRTLLERTDLRARARALAEEYRRYDALGLAVQHIEGMV